MPVAQEVFWNGLSNLPSKYRMETKDFESFDRPSIEESDKLDGNDEAKQENTLYPCLKSSRNLKIQAKVLEAFAVQPSKQAIEKN